ncbi:ribosome silencing factor [bacterium]|nr:ribosome silencing factor [bacterium]
MAKDVTSEKLACVIARVLDDKLGKNLVILNISKVSVLADYFVVCSADTSTQVRALSSYVREKIKDAFERLPDNYENDARNRWNLLDYGDVVVHIMHREERETYAIEKFWNHAFTVPEDVWMEQSKEFAEYSQV